MGFAEYSGRRFPTSWIPLIACGWVFSWVFFFARAGKNRSSNSSRKEGDAGFSIGGQVQADNYMAHWSCAPGIQWFMLQTLFFCFFFPPLANMLFGRSGGSVGGLLGGLYFPEGFGQLRMSFLEWGDVLGKECFATPIGCFTVLAFFFFQF